MLYYLALFTFIPLTTLHTNTLTYASMQTLLKWARKTSMVNMCWMLWPTTNSSVCNVDKSPKDWIQLCGSGDVKVTLLINYDSPNSHIIYLHVSSFGDSLILPYMSWIFPLFWICGFMEWMNSLPFGHLLNVTSPKR